MTVLSNIITPSNVLTTTNTATVTNKTLTSPTVAGMTVSDGTANGVTYLNGSKVLTSGSSFTYNNGLTVNGITQAYNTTLYTVDGTLSNYSATNGVYLAGNAAGWLNLAGDGTNASFIRIYGASYATPNIIQFNTASSEKMRLDASGNLGIGTSSPAQSWTGGSAKVAQLQGGSSQITVFRVNESGGTYGDLQLVSAASAEVGVYNFANGAMRFGTNGTERARINSAGDLLLGISSANAVNGITFASLGASTPYGLINQSASGTLMFFRYNSTTVGSISQNTTATAYNTSSDYRLKNSIAPMTGALEKVALLKPCTYKWNANGSDGEGFIAHELAEVCPDAVTGSKDAVDADGKPQYQGIDVSFLVATLTAAIQEQQAIIDSLKARLDAANL